MIWARIFSQWPPWPPPQLQLQGDHSSQTFQTQSCLGHSLDEPQEDWPNIQKSIWEEAYLHMLVMLMANCTPTYGANFTKKNTWQSFHTTRILESTRVDTHTHTKLRFWDAFSFLFLLLTMTCLTELRNHQRLHLQYVARNSEDAVRKIIEINSVHNDEAWTCTTYSHIHKKHHYYTF